MATTLESPITTVLSLDGVPRSGLVEYPTSGEGAVSDAIAEEDIDDELDDEDDEHEHHLQEVAPEILNEVIIRSGYLYKRGEKRKVRTFQDQASDAQTWKKRWVVLRASQLAFYKNDKEYMTMKVINVSDIRAVVPIEFKRVGLTVGIVTANRTHYLRANSKEETLAWLEAMDQTRSLIQEQNPTAGIAHQLSHTAIGLAEEKPKIANRSMFVMRTEHSPFSIARSVSPPPNILQLCDDGHGPESLTKLAERRTSFSLPAVSPSQHGDENAEAARLAQQLHSVALSSSEEEGDMEFVGVDRAMLLPASVGTGTLASGTAPLNTEHVEDANRVIAQGYLMKQSSRRKQWRKRWFVLTVNTLYYSRSHMDERVHRKLPTAMILDVMECSPTVLPTDHGPLSSLRGLGAVPFSNVPMSLSPPDPWTVVAGGRHEEQGATAETSNTVSFPSTLGKAKRSAEHCFKIITLKRTFLLCAPTEEEDIKWLSALQTILNRRRSASMPLRYH
ncbi:hypothetical protein MVES1_000559 [Malassezia vespertilionis]|uniref:PH domain-containing protein n=1 Tax=Malassezia vespertilionis TaxID=2020962 RepID=A0A2N1JH35_9BASI|nr:uncharacterized protein MVES1_000559 [Malassezia vespertilionis]PKI85848.1 hypothetical protein MVES_000517 [Malassezia vespertilionis]WFD05231.1 hypothetical protein MVES1_000559 [Malassezia vespertilionis]